MTTVAFGGPVFPGSDQLTVMHGGRRRSRKTRTRRRKTRKNTRRRKTRKNTRRKTRKNMRRNTHSTVSPVTRRFPIPEPILSRRFVPLSQSMRGGAAPPQIPPRPTGPAPALDGPTRAAWAAAAIDAERQIAAAEAERRRTQGPGYGGYSRDGPRASTAASAAPPTDPQMENTYIRHQDGQDALDYQTNADGHRVPSGFFKWMWNDAWSGKWAAQNPFREQNKQWKAEGRWKGASNIIAVLSAAVGEHGERPVRVRYKENYNDPRSQEDKAFANIGEAVIWIQGRAKKRRNQLLFGPLYDAVMAVPSTQLLGVGGVRISPQLQAEEAAARGLRKLDEIRRHS
jgi:hypothetical protein